MKFKYLIVNTFDGNLEGTNDDEAAAELSGSEEFFVIDAEEQKWMQEGKLHRIKKMKTEGSEE